jgi:hypothetical protein
MTDPVLVQFQVHTESTCLCFSPSQAGILQRSSRMMSFAGRITPRTLPYPDRGVRSVQLRLAERPGRMRTENPASSTEEPVDTTKLKQCYVKDRVVKLVCDEMASRDRNQNETKMERMLLLLSRSCDEEVRKSELISAFRLLEDAGCGQYVEGRRGWPSRFVWSVRSLDVADAARGQRSLEPTTDGGAEEEADMIEHTFALRPDLAVSFELPDDLTKAEAARLAAFLGTLPFETS